MAQTRKTTVNVKKMKNVKKDKMAALDKKAAGRIVFLRVLILAVVFAIVGVCFYLLTHTSAVDASGFTFEYTFARKILPLLWIPVGLLAVAAGAYLIYSLKKGKDTSADLLTPSMGVILAAYLVAFLALYNLFRETPFLFWTLTALVIVFFAIYYIYNVLMYKK